MSEEELRIAADEAYKQSRMLDEIMKENKE